MWLVAHHGAMNRLRTPFCDSFGVEYPILSAGMAGIAGPELAASVSNSGGLGILAAHANSTSQVVEELALMRSLTDRPFGVNLLLAEDIVSPPCSLDPSLLASVNAVVNDLRAEIGLPAVSGLPSEPARNVEEKLELLLDSRVPVLSIGLGNPGPELVDRCHSRGMRVIAMVASVEDAIAVFESGVDAIVAQGAEAGGHRSHIVKPSSATAGLVGTMVLVPEICDAVRVPVIAAGGISDGRGLVAALALGASGVMIGTRFVASREATVLDVYKDALVLASSQDSTVTDVASGRYARLLRNHFVSTYEASEAPVLPFGWQANALSPVFERAREVQDSSRFPLWSGQVAGRIRGVLPAAEIFDQIVREAEQTLARLK